MTFGRTSAVSVWSVWLRFKGITESRYIDNDYGPGDAPNPPTTHHQNKTLCEVIDTVFDKFVRFTRVPAEVPSGSDSYDFKIRVPVDLPPSFQGKHGCVRYTIEAIVSIKHKPDIEPLDIVKDCKVVNIASGQAAPRAITSAPLSTTEVVPIRAFCCCGKAGVADFGIVVPSRSLAKGAAMLQVRAGITALTAKDLSRGARISLVEHEIYRVGSQTTTEVRVLGSKAIVPEVLRCVPLEPAPLSLDATSEDFASPLSLRIARAAAGTAPHAHLKPVLLEIAPAKSSSFDAANTVIVQHYLILEMGVPWATCASIGMQMWIHSSQILSARVEPPPHAAAMPQE